MRARPHDPTAFTQGLVFSPDERYLYESTGLYGQSELRQLDPVTGEVVARYRLPAQYFAEGLALVGEELWQLTWREGVILIYDRHRLTEGIQRRVAWPYEGWGLTFNGRHLLASDGSATIRLFDPFDPVAPETVVAEWSVQDGGRPVHQLNALAWVRGRLYANVWHSSRIAIIAPSGRVEQWLDLNGLYHHPTDPEAVANGIAWAERSQRLFLTGKRWPVLYETTAVARARFVKKRK